MGQKIIYFDAKSIVYLISQRHDQEEDFREEMCGAYGEVYQCLADMPVAMFYPSESVFMIPPADWNCE